jgi:hypothetical protein
MQTHKPLGICSNSVFLAFEPSFNRCWYSLENFFSSIVVCPLTGLALHVCRKPAYSLIYYF